MYSPSDTPRPNSSSDKQDKTLSVPLSDDSKVTTFSLSSVSFDNLPKLSHHLVDEARLNLLRSVVYLTQQERDDVIDACQFGDIAHIKDKRKSGEPYITHPIAVAEILAGFHLDRDTIIAAILHDTVEDTEVTHEDLVTRYGVVVARLVDGVTKLKSSKHNKQQNKAATFHKILTATLDDPRVLIVKLADRLHNMSTLDAVRPEKQQATARETLDFYVPFARLMGLNDIADYIEVLCYRNLDPVMYTKMSDKLLQQGLGRNFQKDAIHRYLTHVLDKLKLTGHVRVLDNKVNMYRQFFRNRGEMNTLIRQYAFEIVLNSVEACYTLSNYLKQRYQIDDEHIEDNIRRPLPGGNQSMTLTYENENDTIKVTILTQKMQAAARLGVIGAEHASEVSQSVIQASLRNMKDIISIDPQNADNNEQDVDLTVDTIEHLINYLNERKIICYSPRGQAYELPRGATALDFAYAVGSMVGNIAVGANIDGKPAKLGTMVKNGQTVEIEVDKSAKPKAEWLGFAVTNRARRYLRRWLKDLSSEEQRQHGMQALDRALKTYDKSISDLTDENWQSLLTWRNIDDKNALFEQISAGSLLPQLVVSRLFSEDTTLKQAHSQVQGMQMPQQLLADMAGLEIDFAKCCNPIYGDPIMGHLSRDGLVLHRHKCYSLDNIRDFSPYQLFQLHWLDEDTITNRIKHPSDRAHFTVYLKLNLALNEEQVSQAIYELRQVNIGVKKVDVHTSTTIIHVVVRSRSHVTEGIHALRTHLGFPNVARLYQYDNSDRNTDKK